MIGNFPTEHFNNTTHTAIHETTGACSSDYPNISDSHQLAMNNKPANPFCLLLFPYHVQRSFQLNE
jgi:hypothetical protein